MGNEWKNCAKNLAKALRRTNLDCNQLDHSGGFYHEVSSECPIVAMIKESLENYEKLLKNECVK
jgi:uncharacterized protein YaaQ